MVETLDVSGMAPLMQEVLESGSGSVAGSEGMAVQQASNLQDTEGDNFSEAKSTFDEIEVVCGRTDHGSNGDLLHPEDVRDGEKVAVSVTKETELSGVLTCAEGDAETSQGGEKEKSRELVVEEVMKRLEVCEGITEVQQETVNGTGFETEEKSAPQVLDEDGTGSKLSTRPNSNDVLLLPKKTSQGSGFQNPMLSSSRFDAREAQEVQEKVKSLERELNIKCSELDSMKQTFEEREHEFLYKIECLELANQQLLDGGADASVQLQMELSRLQRQNSMLSMRERELEFQLSTQEMLNEQLKDTSLNDNKGAEAAKSLEARIAALKLELAEAVEVNNMYKIQLHEAFAQQKQVHAVALQNSGNVEDVVKELLQLRQRTKAQEDELQDLQDRFFLISVRLAESVAQREELMMKVKRIQHLKH